jgi:dTMP kinase
MSTTGFFITFEGSEGCGKSTQIQCLAEHLRTSGHEPLLLREPGGTPEGEALTPEAELLLFAASRAQLVREVIQPALDAGRIVICDRFMDSTTVYQGVARRIDPAQTDLINAFAMGSVRPHITFVLDVDRATARQRMSASRAKLDRIERESEAFFEAVRQGYLTLAQNHPDRIVLVDAAQSIQATGRDILTSIANKYPDLLKK